ncbi:ABC transporter ATP-binding protein [soil metagenome]
MSLRFEAALAARDFDVSLEVAEGETVAVLGPNGAGKSTLLGILAGLVRPDSGTATLGDDTLFSGREWVPAHRRQVALLSQAALLFPHLTARENVAFGPRSAGHGRAASRASAEEWLGALEAGDLAAVKPGELSGGQAQRVAIARALAAEPRLLLLDEPLAALDRAVVPGIRRMLRRVLENRTALLVTHEPLDALALADRVIVLDRGRVVEHGPTVDVLERPQHEFTAELAGLNLLRGTRTATGLVTRDGVPLDGVVTEDIPIGAPVAAAIRPAAIEVLPSSAAGMRATVTELEPRGGTVRVRAGGLVADLAPGRLAALGIGEGSDIRLLLPKAELAVYPRR